MGSGTPRSSFRNTGTAANTSGQLCCKLMTPELQKRKQTVIASLKHKIMGRKELHDGYAFTFPGTDKVIDELIEFVKTERQCCDFFTFRVTITGDKGTALLDLTGPVGTKEFMISELGL